MSGKLHIEKAKLSDVEIVKFGGDTPSSLAKYTVDGPIFFGTAKVFEDKYPQLLKSGATKIILDMEHLSVVDATGEAVLFALLDDAEQKGIKIIIKRLPKG